ncbi:MAG: hypothetical protein ABSG90_12260 [Dehalococcoidia bacterium]|jgi:hypothetical protein
MNLPVYKIYVDWDCADWAGVHDFTQSYDDITGDVKHLSISRGKDRDANTYPAATMEMVLNNFAGRYYPTTITGDLVGKIRLWLPVMAQATFNGTTYTLFYGFLNRITAYPIKDKQNIYFYATDGIDLLTKTIVVQDMDHKTVMSDGEAVHQVLNAAGWKMADVACTMQNSGNTVTASNHGLVGNSTIMFSGASIPSGLDPLQVYYVINPLTNTFQVSLTPGGSVVLMGSDGSGYYCQVLRRAVDMDGGDIDYFPKTFEFSPTT